MLIAGTGFPVISRCRHDQFDNNEHRKEGAVDRIPHRSGWEPKRPAV